MNSAGKHGTSWSGWRSCREYKAHAWDKPRPADRRLFDEAARHLEAEDFERALITLAPGMETSPFSPAIHDAVIESVTRIIEVENERGDIQRVERSALAHEAQPYQNFIDRLFYMMAGLTEAEVEGLEQRLGEML